jgi:hypothetical protein
LNGVRTTNQSNQSVATSSNQQPPQVSFSENTISGEQDNEHEEEQTPQMTVNTPWNSYQQTPYISSLHYARWSKRLLVLKNLPLLH